MSDYYISFDCETTGILPNCNILTAYFIILDKNLNKIDELELNIKHKYYIVYINALKINNIDLIKHDNIAISKNDAIIKLKDFLNNYTKLKIIGHNIKFDINMLKSNLILSSDDIDNYFDLNNIFDTFKIARLMKSKKKINKCQSLSLSKICYYFDIQINNTESNFHSAKYDTLCTVELFKKLIELNNN